MVAPVDQPGPDGAFSGFESLPDLIRRHAASRPRAGALVDSHGRLDYAELDRVMDRIAIALEGFEHFNQRVREPAGFRIQQAARERIFMTESTRAEFSLAPLVDALPDADRLMLSTVRSHDQFNTSIYSNDDRYRGVKNLRTLLFMNEDDMRERGLTNFDRIDITSIARDGTRRSVYGYVAVKYNVPPGSTLGYMPELNVLCAVTDYSSKSRQPVMKHVSVEVVPSQAR